MPTSATPWQRYPRRRCLQWPCPRRRCPRRCHGGGAQGEGRRVPPATSRLSPVPDRYSQDPLVLIPRRNGSQGACLVQSRLGNKRELVNRAAGSTAIVPPGAKPGPTPWRCWDGRPGHPELAARRRPCLRLGSRRAEARGAAPGAVPPGPVPCRRGGFGATAGWRGARRPRGAGADGGSPAMPAPRLPQRSCAGASAMGATSSAQPRPPCCHLCPPAGGPAVGPPAPPSSAPWEVGCCRGARGARSRLASAPLGDSQVPVRVLPRARGDRHCPVPPCGRGPVPSWATPPPALPSRSHRL